MFTKAMERSTIFVRKLSISMAIFIRYVKLSGLFGCKKTCWTVVFSPTARPASMERPSFSLCFSAGCHQDGPRAGDRNSEKVSWPVENSPCVDRTGNSMAFYLHVTWLQGTNMYIYIYVVFCAYVFICYCIYIYMYLHTLQMTIICVCTCNTRTDESHVPYRCDLGYRLQSWLLEGDEPK